MAGDRHGEAVVLLRPSKHDVQILRCAQDDRLGHTRIVVILSGRLETILVSKSGLWAGPRIFNPKD